MREARRSAPPYRSYQLKVPKGHWDLKDYIFTDEEHAQKWMAQDFLVGEDYRAIAVIVHPARCPCGEHVCRGRVTRDRSRPDILPKTPTGEAVP